MKINNLVLAVSMALLSAAASAEVITTLANLPNVKPSSQQPATMIVLTDPGKEGLFIPGGSTGVVDNAVTIKDGNGTVYKRLVTGPINAGWWLSTAASNNYDAINKAIAFAPNGGEIYIPPGRYQFLQPILLLDNKSLTIRSKGTLVFPNSDGIIVRGRQTLELEKIESARAYEERPNYANYTNSGVVLEDATHSDVFVNVVAGFANGIHLTATGQQGQTYKNQVLGTQYNRVTFNSLYHNKVGIFLSTGKVSNAPDLVDGAEPWVNENTITGGAIRGETGLLTVKGANQLDKFNGNKFYNLGFESLAVAFDLQSARNNMIIAPRFEGEPKPMNFDASSRGNVMITSEVYREGLATNPGSENIIIGSIMKSGGVLTAPIEASSAITTNNPVSTLRPILKNVEVK
jgi:Pectate lyase superfamily protein